MRQARGLWLALAGGLTLSLSGCCTFMTLSGGGPVAYDELGDWAGLEAPATRPPGQLRMRERDLLTCRDDFFAGEEAYQETDRLDAHPLAAGLYVQGRFNSWLAGVPSSRNGHWLFRLEDAEAGRRFYAEQEQWGLGWLLPVPLGELLFHGNRTVAYDVASGRRIGATTTDVLLLGLACLSERHIRPVDSIGRAGLRVVVGLDTDLAKARYEIRDGTAILFGLLGWGRVNRTEYVQVLWIPIATGSAVEAAEPAADAAASKAGP